jgi:hypothetical protein
MALWVSKGGLNSGIVGDAAHASRSSYHNGFDVASRLAGSTNLATVAKTDYSYRLPRDKVTSNAAAAMDLGKLGGSLGKLQAFSRWFVAQAHANPTKYRDVREVIYSPDGKVVKRWSGPDNKIYDVPLDNDVARSHLWHTHISWYRDSEKRDKRPLFATYFAPAPAPTPIVTEAAMPTISSYIPGQVATIKKTSNIRSEPKMVSTNILRVLAAPESWTVTGWVKGDVDPQGGSDQWLVRWAGGRWEYTAKSNASEGPAPAVATTIDCTAAVKAATTPMQATIDSQAATIAQLKNGATTAATTERDRIADAEATRIKSI